MIAPNGKEYLYLLSRYIPQTNVENWSKTLKIRTRVRMFSENKGEEEDRKTSLIGPI